jgi:molybdate transport system substrate-binding protein
MKTSITSSIGRSGDTVNAKARLAPQSGPLREKPASPSGVLQGLYNRESLHDLEITRLGDKPGMKKLASCWIVLLLVITSAWGKAPQEKSPREITVAAAADLSSALKEIVENYEKETGIKVKLSFGASGALTQQIHNRAPFDVFFSADMDYPRQLISYGDAERSSLYRYAIGKLVLWVPADSPLDVEHKGMNTLADPSVKKIAIANPQHAPYGRAAVAAMKHVGLYDQVADRLVLGENISQAAQFVESGNAQIGFVAMAHVTSPAMQGKGKYWQIPVEAYPPLEQGVVVTRRSRHKREALAFVKYIQTKQVADVLSRYGFTVPDQQEAASK